MKAFFIPGDWGFCLEAVWQLTKNDHNVILNELFWSLWYFSHVVRRCEEAKAEGHPKWRRNSRGQARTRWKWSGERLWNALEVISAEPSTNPLIFSFSNNSHVQLSAVSSHVKFRKVRLRQVKVQSSMFHSFRLQMSFFHELCSDELRWADMLMWDSCGVCT